MARKNLLKGFKKPKGIIFEHLENNPNYGKFTAYPFEPGFGTTVGNTLRRVLLSSIQGYAISSVRITSYDADGVPHVISSEFETIPNISEDTLEVLNSLKQIRLRLPRDVKIWFHKQCWEPARFFYVEQRLQAVINTVRLKKHTDGVKKVLTDLLQSENDEVKIQSYKDMLAMQDKIVNVENVTEDEVALVSGREDEFGDVLSGKIPYQSKNK